MTDLTGGVAEIFDLEKAVKSSKDPKTSAHNSSVLWKMINKSFKMGSICSAAIWAKEKNTRENVLSNGLVDGVNLIYGK